MTLVNASLKYVIGAPIIYYYGLSAIGYALCFFAPTIAIYLNPTVLMANGTHYFNTVLLLLVNFVPLYVAIGIVLYKNKYVEI